MLTWNAIAACSKEHVYRVLLLYLVVISALERQLLVTARVIRELQGSADMVYHDIILDLSFLEKRFLKKNKGE